MDNTNQRFEQPSPEVNNTSTYLSDPNIAVADHAYFTLTNENTTTAQNCLDDEYEETLNTTNGLCDYINTDHAYIQTDCKRISIADYSLDNELDTSDDIEYVPVEEQCIRYILYLIAPLVSSNSSSTPDQNHKKLLLQFNFAQEHS